MLLGSVPDSTAVQDSVDKSRCKTPSLSFRNFEWNVYGNMYLYILLGICIFISYLIYVSSYLGICIFISYLVYVSSYLTWYMYLYILLGICLAPLKCLCLIFFYGATAHVGPSPSLSHTHDTTPLNVWSAQHRGCCLHNPQQRPQTNIHALSGFRICEPNSQVAADLRLRPRGHRVRLCV
jgi:hypothetical protein